MATQRIYKGTTLGAASAGDTFEITEGGTSITGNVDYSSVNTSVLMEISPTFLGDIGTASAPLKTAFSSALIHGGRGTVWFNNTSLDTAATAIVWVTGGGHLQYLGSAAAVTRLEIARGALTAGNGALITNAWFAPGSSGWIQDTGTGGTLTLLNNLGGNVVSERPHTTINQADGILTLQADQAGGRNTQGTINLYGGRLVIRDSSTITALNALGALPDLSQIASQLTITDTTVNMLLPGAQAFLDHPRITFTNTPSRRFTDGRPIAA